MRLSAGLPAGVSALLFDEARRRRELEADLVATLEAGDFREVILPVLDYYEPYAPLLTRSARGELYRFADRDGQMLALRGDFTPMLARLLAPRFDAWHADEGEPLRVYYRGDVVRHQEARPGRLREYYQLGVELIDAEGTESERQRADEEALTLFIELVDRALGSSLKTAGPLRLVLGFAGALDDLLRQVPDLSPHDLAAALIRRDREVARAAGEDFLSIVETGVPRNAEALGGAAVRFEQLMTLCEALGPRVKEGRLELSVDLAEYATNTLAADLVFEDSAWTYYDGIVFRAYPPASAAPIGQGGRYDRLFHTLECKVAAVGFSIGLDRILQLSGRSNRSHEGASQETARLGEPR